MKAEGAAIGNTFETSSSPLFAIYSSPCPSPVPFFSSKEKSECATLEAAGGSEKAKASATPAKAAISDDKEGSSGAAGAERDREMVYQCLVDGLEEQKGRLVARTMERYNAGDKMAALQLNIEKKHVVEILDWVQTRRGQGKPAPVHRFLSQLCCQRHTFSGHSDICHRFHFSHQTSFLVSTNRLDS